MEPFPGQSERANGSSTIEEFNRRQPFYGKEVGDFIEDGGRRSYGAPRAKPVVPPSADKFSSFFIKNIAIYYNGDCHFNQL